MKFQCTLLLLLFSILPVVSADQDYTKWHLPEGAKARLGKGAVEDVVYSPDGNSIAVASRIGIWLYDAQTYQEVFLLTGHTRSIESVVFSPDSETLASLGRDDTIRLWDVSTGKLKQTFEGHPFGVFGVNSVLFSPDGQTLASDSSSGTIRLWDVLTGQQKHTFQGSQGGVRHPSGVYSVMFSPDGQTLASGCGGVDRTIRLWDVATGQQKHTFRGHTARVWSVVFSPDGQTLASGSHDGTVLLWDLTLIKQNK